MNTRRIIFWASFIIVLVLIIWGLIVAMNKPQNGNIITPKTPAQVTEIDHVTNSVIVSSTSPVTLIEYSDFQCPACDAYHTLVEELLASSTVPIRFVYRHFPLAQHANAIPAAIASEAASLQGKFWDMYHLLFLDPIEWTELEDPTDIFVSYASKIGIDIEKFKIDLKDSKLKERILNDQKEGLKIGINATPTFFINGKFISNPQNYEEFKKLIEEAATNSTK